MTSALLLAPAAQAADLSLNFDEGPKGADLLYNADGSLQLDQWAELGVKLGVESNREGSVGLLNTYNTEASGRDNTLMTGSTFGTELQGNALIIQEEKGAPGVKGANFSNGTYIEDDEELGGKIDFDFDSAVSLTSFSLLNISPKDQGLRVQGFNSGQQLLDIDVNTLINQHHATNGNIQGSMFTQDGVTVTQLGTNRGRNSMYQFDLDETYFDVMQNLEFTYPGSGAVTNIAWSTIPQGGSQEVPEPSVIGGLLMLGYVGTRKYLKKNEAA